MQKHLLYIHGLGSNAQSRKYRLLKSVLEHEMSMACLEWKNDDNISLLLAGAANRLQHCKHVVLVGDSTGGNFAYQLRELMRPFAVKTTLILLNPLLDIERRIAIFAFPESLILYLKRINSPKDAHIFIAKRDEIIDHHWLKHQPMLNTVFYEFDDTHRFTNFESCVYMMRSIIGK